MSPLQTDSCTIVCVSCNDRFLRSNTIVVAHSLARLALRIMDPPSVAPVLSIASGPAVVVTSSLDGAVSSFEAGG